MGLFGRKSKKDKRAKVASQEEVLKTPTRKPTVVVSTPPETPPETPPTELVKEGALDDLNTDEPTVELVKDEPDVAAGDPATTEDKDEPEDEPEPEVAVGDGPEVASSTVSEEASEIAEGAAQDGAETDEPEGVTRALVDFFEQISMGACDFKKMLSTEEEEEATEEKDESEVVTEDDEASTEEEEVTTEEKDEPEVVGEDGAATEEEVTTEEKEKEEVVAVTEEEIISDPEDEPEVAVDDGGSVVTPVVSGETDSVEEYAVQDEAKKDEPEDFSIKLLEIFECASLETVQKIVAPSIDMLPSAVQEMLPDMGDVKKSVDVEYYDDAFATKFLDDILNVGYALVYHQPTDEEENFMGRSVTMIMKRGVCSAEELAPPMLEFKTMGGGKDNQVETRSIALSDLHSISMSPNVEEMKEDVDCDDEEKEELQCHFTITTSDGGIYIFEALSSNESRRLVHGMKNICARMSKQMISGDDRILAEFYEKEKESEEIKLSPQEAMMRLSLTFL